MEAAVNYNRTFNDDHTVTGLLVGTAREFLDGNASNLQLSLPGRNIGISGRFSYDYKNTYFAEVNFGFNGSERFAKNNRFGFFPSIGFGWLVSNESFFEKSKLSSVISRLKLRASYGLVGNDRIGNSRTDRFFYLSEVSLINNGRGYLFGENFGEFIPGVSINRYANPLVTWELAEKANFGLDVNLFDDALQFRVDAFFENRTNILQTRVDIPSTLGLQTSLQTNVGEVKAYGFDGSLDYNHSFNDNFWMSGRATLTYADNEYTVFEEPDYSKIGAPWRSNIGRNVRQNVGFIAERLFVDDAEAINSPAQLTGTPGEDYGGGDIKYKDLNGDGQITELDLTGIGNPSVPKITYGFGVSMGYKRFDLSMFFQGLGQTSFLIRPGEISPFTNTITASDGNDVIEGLGIIFQQNGRPPGNGFIGENGLLQAIADNHWSEENRDVYALWPRLSENRVANNEVNSTYWLRDGAFLRLKQLELGFNVFGEKEKERLGLTRFRVYLTGTNLFLFSKFKLWDPEFQHKGLNYPLQRVVNLGFQIGF